MKNEVQSIAFNPKGTTVRERLEIRNVDAMAAKYIHNYQVNGEVLTGAQEAAQTLTGIPGLGPQDLLMSAPGPVTKLPAIRPDGTESDLLKEVAAKLLIDSDYEVTGSLDRHGIVFAIRGIDEVITRTETEALDAVLKSHN